MSFEHLLNVSSPPQATVGSHQPMSWWQGVSGRWYVHSIFPFSANVFLDGANYIFVRREWDGKRTGLYIGQSENLRERLPKHEKLAAASRLGANELHAHLLANSARERFEIESDLRNGHKTPLNEQGSPYSFSELFGAAHRNNFAQQEIVNVLMGRF